MSRSRSRRTIDALNAEHDRLEAEYQDADELPEAVDQRLGEIEMALLAFEKPIRGLRSRRYRPSRRLRQHRFPTGGSQ